MDGDLIAAHGEVEALMPYLHLPAQAGSDRVLKAMNRGYSAGDYLKLVEHVRAARPPTSRCPARTSSWGSLGETAADFEARRSRSCARWATRAPSRSSTPAGPARPARPCAQIAEAEKDERLQRPQALLRRTTGRLQRRPRRPDPRRAVRQARPPRRPAFDRAQPSICRRCTRSHRRRPSARSCRSGSRPPRPTASAACSWARRVASSRFESRAVREFVPLSDAAAGLVRGVRPWKWQEAPRRADRGRLQCWSRPRAAGVARRRRARARGGQAGGEVDRRKGGPRMSRSRGRHAVMRRRPHRVAGWRALPGARPAC